MIAAITAQVTEKLAVLAQVGLTAPAEEAVVLLTKDSKLAPVPLLAVIKNLDVYLTLPVVVLVQVGLTAPVVEAVVLPPKDSKLEPVLLQAVILNLSAWLTAHAFPLPFLI